MPKIGKKIDIVGDVRGLPKKAGKTSPPGKEFSFFDPGKNQVIGKANSVKQLADVIKSAPLSSVLYHVNGGHFVPWIEMLGEKGIADKVKYIKGNGESVREALLKTLA